jgi:hypothetical protein
LGELEIARVNLPVGALDLGDDRPDADTHRFRRVAPGDRSWRGIGVTLVVNWAIKPFSMALLAWFFVRGVFAPMAAAEELDSYVAGLILLAAAPCTAMVFVWSQLTRGDPYFTLSQVALNDSSWSSPSRRSSGCCSACPRSSCLGHAARVRRPLHRRAAAASRSCAPSCCRRAAGGSSPPRCDGCSPHRSRRSSLRWCSCSRSRASRCCANRW